MHIHIYTHTHTHLHAHRHILQHILNSGDRAWVLGVFHLFCNKLPRRLSQSCLSPGIPKDRKRLQGALTRAGWGRGRLRGGWARCSAGMGLRLPGAPQSCGPAPRSPPGDSSLPEASSTWWFSPRTGNTCQVCHTPAPSPSRCGCAGRGNARNLSLPQPFAETRPENPQRPAPEPRVSQFFSCGGTRNSSRNLAVPESREL